jgi:serine/threonine protein kinase/dipeptidyl aminopeptidase/acylaminoacyl peptidase
VGEVIEQLRAALADRYSIEREIGSGGMATVYLADERKHRRQVAIKVMRPEFAASLGAERFLREIQISAQLNHPNILTLIDSGEVDGTLYYVMPYLAGESLRDRMNREGQLPIEDCLEITKEVADALGYAHSRGLIHRDIKPENIMFEAGHAVVTDFGIARALSAAGGETLTETGLAVGTPAYMSPEQATGERDIDGRSDVYALGCVLYEMLAGDAPYTASTPQALIAKKLSEPLPRVSVVRETVPSGVEQALLKALAKNRVDRFATPEEFSKALTTPSDGRWMEQPTARRGRWTRKRVVLGSVVVAVTAATVVIGAVLSRLVTSGPITITTSNIRAVTSEPGMEWQPVLSPDGSQVAFLAQREGRQSIVIRSTVNIGSGEELLPVQGQRDGLELFPAWSPDGEFVRFADCLAGALGCAMMEVARIGGQARPITLPSNALGPSWSPDGSRVAFTAGPDSILIYRVNDRTTTLLTVHDEPLNHSFVWSPDGKWIAFVNDNPTWLWSFNVFASSIWMVGADDGELVRVTEDDFMDVSPAWLDEHHVLFISNREGLREVYVVEVGPSGPRGEPQKVPGVTDPHSISYSVEGSKLAFSKATARQNIWSYPLGSGPVSIRDGFPVTSDNALVEEHDVSHDGKWIAYGSGLRGNSDIYRRHRDGGSPVPITDSPFDEFGPRWSPDGTEIAFYIGAIAPAVMVVPAAGGIPYELGSGHTPAWSHSGLEIAFLSVQTGQPGVAIVSRDSVGGTWRAPSQVTDSICWTSDWAPDDSGVLCAPWASDEMLLVSREGEVLWRYDLTAVGLRGPRWSLMRPRFSREGATVYVPAYRDDGFGGIWAIPLHGGEPSLVVETAELTAPGLISVGPDRLYVTVEEHESDIWVMDVEVER